MVQLTTNNENNNKLIIFDLKMTNFTRVRKFSRLLQLSLNNRSEKKLSKKKIK